MGGYRAHTPQGANAPKIIINPPAGGQRAYGYNGGGAPKPNYHNAGGGIKPSAAAPLRGPSPSGLAIGGMDYAAY